MTHTVGTPISIRAPVFISALDRQVIMIITAGVAGTTGGITGTTGAGIIGVGLLLLTTTPTTVGIVIRLITGAATTATMAIPASITTTITTHHFR